MDEDRLTIDPPLYLIGKMYSCWRCGAKMPVVAILAPKVEGTEGEICILSGITELPRVAGKSVRKYTLSSNPFQCNRVQGNYAKFSTRCCGIPWG
jgi:hypothetical protein